jgi:hypothetical protein
MKQENFTDEPLDIEVSVPEEPQWFKVEGRLGERIHQVGPKFTAGHVMANNLQHAKESYLSYMGQFFDMVEVLRVTPEGNPSTFGLNVFPAKRNLK